MIMQELYWAISARRHKLFWDLAWKLFRWLNRGKIFRCFKPEWVAKCFDTDVETWGGYGYEEKGT